MKPHGWLSAAQTTELDPLHKLLMVYFEGQKRVCRAGRLQWQGASLLQRPSFVQTDKREHILQEERGFNFDSLNPSLTSNCHVLVYIMPHDYDPMLSSKRSYMEDQTYRREQH